MKFMNDNSAKKIIRVVLMVTLLVSLRISAVWAQSRDVMVISDTVVVETGTREILNTEIKPASDFSADAMILVKSGAVLRIAENSVFDLSGNGQYKHGIEVESGGKLIFEDTLITGGNGNCESLIHSDGGDLQFLDGAVVENNTSALSWGRVIWLYRGTMTVKGAAFRNNTVGYLIYVSDSDVLVDHGTFSENTGGYLGGAISFYGGKLTITDSLFEKNRVGDRGGAIYFHGIVPDRKAVMEITRTQFVENIADGWGGAIAMEGYTDGMDEEGDDAAVAYIHSAEFSRNGAYSKSGKYGGAIYQDFRTKLYMSRVAVIDNAAGENGGGISVSNLSSCFVKERNGAVVFDNHLYDGTASDVYAFRESDYAFSDKMFNGGMHNWTSQLITVYEPDDMEVLVSEPSRREDEDALVIFRDNIAYDTDDGSGWGGAIHVWGGYLEIGEDGVSFEVTKSWDDEHDLNGKRPSPEEFLRSLTLYANGQVYETGGVVLLERTDLEDGGSRYLFTYSDDPGTHVILEDRENDVYSLTFDTLPKFIADTEAEYDIIEAENEFYTNEKTGDMKTGFVLTGTYIREPEPTLVPTVTPTVTPQPPEPTEPAHSFFYRLESLEQLPDTGF